jgi:hypothetical protein
MDTNPSLKSTSFIGVSDLFQQTIQWYKDHWRLLVTIQAIPFAIGVISAITLSITHDSTTQGVYSGIYGLLSLLASGFSWLALMLVISHEENMTWQEAYKKSLSFAIPSFVVLLLSVLFTLGGLLLFIIPGIYLSIAYSFSQYAFFSDDKRGMEALRASKFYVKGNWWGVLGRSLLFGLAIGIIQMILGAGSVAPQWEILRKAVEEGTKPEIQQSPVFGILGSAFAILVATPLGIIYTFLMYKSLKEVKGEYNLHTEITK